MREQGERAKPSSIAEVLETDEAKGLLEAGRTSGSLSTEEITAGLGELELDAAQIDDFYHVLEELQIDVVVGDQPTEALDDASSFEDRRRLRRGHTAHHRPRAAWPVPPRRPRPRS